MDETRRYDLRPEPGFRLSAASKWNEAFLTVA